MDLEPKHDTVWQEIGERLVISLSKKMPSIQSACDGFWTN